MTTTARRLRKSTRKTKCPCCRSHWSPCAGDAMCRIRIPRGDARLLRGTPNTDNDEMSAGRIRVLEIGAEGARFELDAELDDDGNARSFFVWTGGPHGFEELLEEAPEPRVAHGPTTWPDVLETWLGPHQWLELFPLLIHPSVAELVRTELPHASEEARARWSNALKPAMFRARGLRA